jgi:hypothetical protein
MNSETREIVRDTRNPEKCVSPDAKVPMLVLGGGRFLMCELPLYGTDPREIQCLSLQWYLASEQGFLASEKRPPPP